MKIPVYFCDEMVAQSGNADSPSSYKPKHFVEALITGGYDVEIRRPEPVTTEDFYAVHYKECVDGIFALTWPNGFGTFSPSVAKSLPYTSGAMYCAAKAATKDIPAIAPVSGFHHAERHKAMGFCTFNGLMVTAAKMIKESQARVAIVDADMHYGNGTDDIMSRLNLNVYHKTFGQLYGGGQNAAGKYPDGWKDAERYLNHFTQLKYELQDFKPTIILYQAGGDVHIDDPYGGVLNTVQMYDRDVKMFTIAKELGVPLAWNLAGGYQTPIEKVIELHINTVKAARLVYG